MHGDWGAEVGLLDFYRNIRLLRYVTQICVLALEPTWQRHQPCRNVGYICTSHTREDHLYLNLNPIVMSGFWHMYYIIEQ